MANELMTVMDYYPSANERIGVYEAAQNMLDRRQDRVRQAQADEIYRRQFEQQYAGNEFAQQQERKQAAEAEDYQNRMLAWQQEDFTKEYPDVPQNELARLQSAPPIQPPQAGEGIGMLQPPAPRELSPPQQKMSKLGPAVAPEMAAPGGQGSPVMPSRPSVPSAQSMQRPMPTTPGAARADEAKIAAVANRFLSDFQGPMNAAWASKDEENVHKLSKMQYQLGLKYGIPTFVAAGEAGMSVKFGTKGSTMVIDFSKPASREVYEKFTGNPAPDDNVMMEFDVAVNPDGSKTLSGGKAIKQSAQWADLPPVTIDGQTFQVQKDKTSGQERKILQSSGISAKAAASGSDREKTARYIALMAGVKKENMQARADAQKGESLFGLMKAMRNTIEGKMKSYLDAHPEAASRGGGIWNDFVQGRIKEEGAYLGIAADLHEFMLDYAKIASRNFGIKAADAETQKKFERNFSGGSGFNSLKTQLGSALASTGTAVGQLHEEADKTDRDIVTMDAETAALVKGEGGLENRRPLEEKFDPSKRDEKRAAGKKPTYSQALAMGMAAGRPKKDVIAYLDANPSVWSGK